MRPARVSFSRVFSSLPTSFTLNPNYLFIIFFSIHISFQSKNRKIFVEKAAIWHCLCRKITEVLKKVENKFPLENDIKKGCQRKLHSKFFKVA